MAGANLALRSTGRSSPHSVPRCLPCTGPLAVSLASSPFSERIQNVRGFARASPRVNAAKLVSPRARVARGKSPCSSCSVRLRHSPWHPSRQRSSFSSSPSVVSVGRSPIMHAEKHAAPPASGEHEHEHHDELVRRVKLTEAVVRDAAIESAPARREAIGATLSLPGEIAADPDRTARISSPAAGRIEEARLREGESVKKGDVLVVVRVPEIGKVRSAMSSTAARATSARTNAERQKRLVAEGLATEQQALDAQTEADALEVEARSLRERARRARRRGERRAFDHAARADGRHRRGAQRRRRSAGHAGAGARHDRGARRGLVSRARFRERPRAAAHRRRRRGAPQRLPRGAFRGTRRVHRSRGRPGRTHAHGAPAARERARISCGSASSAPPRSSSRASARRRRSSSCRARRSPRWRARPSCSCAHGDDGIRAARGHARQAKRPARWRSSRACAKARAVVTDGVFTLKSVVLKRHVRRGRTGH